MKDQKTNRRRFLQGAASAAGALGAVPALAAGSAQLVKSTPGKSSGEIPKRVLGRTGVSLPILHLGTSQDLDPKYDKVMHRSFKAGVTWFDTALSYGWGASHAAVKTFLGQIGDRDTTTTAPRGM